MATSVGHQTAGSAAAASSPIYVYLISLVAAVGGFLFGYDLSIISGAVLFLNKEFNLTAFQLGLMVGCASLGYIPGPLLAAGISDRIGKKRAWFWPPLSLAFVPRVRRRHPVRRSSCFSA